MADLRYGELNVSIFPTNESLGEKAAEDFALAVHAALGSREEIAVILAAANSQLSFFRALRERDDIDWSRISFLHMDEFLGMPADHSASFSRWIRKNLIEAVNPKAFYEIRGDHTPVEDELVRYSLLIRELDPSICVMGIGENGHLAFNDPPADFQTEELVHVVDLAEAARMQQVGEGHFLSIDEVPRRAISLTVHALLQPATLMVIAPESRKGQAVKTAIEGPVTPLCPASILQTQQNARLYLDEDSAALLDPNHV